MTVFSDKIRSQELPLSTVISERRATPNFDGSAVPDDILAAIIKAGMESPSGYNLQPWRFIVVRNPRAKAPLASGRHEPAQSRRSGSSDCVLR